MAFVEHDDLVLFLHFIHHVPECEQRVSTGQYRSPPGGVALVADHQTALVVTDGFVKQGRLFSLLQACEVVLYNVKGK